MKVCGDCIYRHAERRICLLNLAYQAFIYPDTPANGCTGYHEKGRAAAEQQAQSECRPVDIPPLYRQFVPGLKP